YHLAIVSSSYWASTVQALVNVGRVKLAQQMGLEMPATVDAEREMWWLVTEFVSNGFGPAACELDKYRKSAARLGEQAAETEIYEEGEKAEGPSESVEEDVDNSDEVT